jgi:type VI protein secretion system component Hcp
MSEQRGYLEFAKFDPGPKSKGHKYADYQDACILQHPQGDSFTSQGADAGPEIHSLHLVFHIGSADANEFGKACANNKTSAVKSVEIASTFMLNGKRLEKKKVKYENLTVKQVQVDSSSGEAKALVSCIIEYEKATGKITDYKTDGTVETSSDVKVDLSLGTFE